MKRQEYLLKKFVMATSAADAISKDAETPVHEAYLVETQPAVENGADAVGFKIIEPE